MSIVHPYIFKGGAEKLILYLVHHLQKMGVQVNVITLSVNLDGLPDFTNEIKFLEPRHPLSYDDLQRRLISEWRPVKATMDHIEELIMLRKAVRDHAKDVDILNPHNFPAHWATCTLGKPVIWNCNDAYRGSLPGQEIRITRGGEEKRVVPVGKGDSWIHITRKCRALLDRFIVRSSVNELVVLDDFNYKLAWNFYPQKPIVVNPGIDYDFFTEGDGKAIMRKYDLDTDDFIILQTGRLAENKGSHTSIIATYLLKDRIENLKLVIVGEGPEKANITRQTKELGIVDKVIFTGEVTEEELRNWYHACTINLNPATGYGWLMTPFEALSAGKLPVVSNLCGVSNLVSRYNIGIVVKPFPEEVAEAIARFHESPEEYEYMIIRGREYVKRELTWRRFAEKMYTVMIRCLTREERHLKTFNVV